VTLASRKESPWLSQEVKDTHPAKKLAYKAWLQKKAETFWQLQYAEKRKTTVRATRILKYNP